MFTDGSGFRGRYSTASFHSQPANAGGELPSIRRVPRLLGVTGALVRVLVLAVVLAFCMRFG